MFAKGASILPVKTEFKTNKLLSFYRPFPFGSSYFMTKVKINWEWLKVKAAKMSVFQ